MNQTARAKLDRLLKKDLNDITGDDIAFLLARMSYLKKKQKERFAKLLSQPAKAARKDAKKTKKAP